MFIQLVFDQSTETWVRLHVEAFEYFGGVPAVIVMDNLKAAVIRAAFAIDDKSVLNRSTASARCSSGHVDRQL
jgi:transposase